MNKNLTIGLIVFAIIFFVAKPSMFIVKETEQVVVVRLGDPIRIVKEPGIYFKIPLTDDVEYFYDLILDYDSNSKDIITRDKKTLLVDNYAKWKIKEPLKFFTTVISINGAQKRLDDIIYSELRVEIGKHNLIDIVSGSRNKIMNKVTKESNKKASQYGIEIIDVRIKRADLPKENASAIYGRMRTERERIAREYRSQGEEESLKIKSKTNMERTIMLSDAYKREQAIRGGGDAESIKIYAEALGEDPEFYKFVRTLEAYKKTFNSGDTIVVSPDSEFFKYFKKMY